MQLLGSLLRLIIKHLKNLEKMKASIKLILSAVTITLLISSCTIWEDGIRPSKHYITRSYNIGDFNKIDASTLASIHYVQSADSSTSLEIYGSDNIVPLIKVYVENGTLYLTTKKNKKINNSGKLKIQIKTPDLHAIYFKGVGDIYVDSGLRTQSLEVESKGVGNIKIKNLVCESVNINSLGVGDVEIEGTAQTVTLRSKGVGNIEADELKAQNVEASSMGIGSISCFAANKLNASVKGIGGINYKGNPEHKNLSKGGIGSINAIN